MSDFYSNYFNKIWRLLKKGTKVIIIIITIIIIVSLVGWLI